MGEPHNFELLRSVEAELGKAQAALVNRPTSLDWQISLQKAAQDLAEFRQSDFASGDIRAMRAGLENIRKLVSSCELLLDSGLVFLCGCNAALNESDPSGYGPGISGQLWAEAGS